MVQIGLTKYKVKITSFCTVGLFFLTIFLYFVKPETNISVEPTKTILSDTTIIEFVSDTVSKIIIIK